jgi:6-phosphogluconate dehydrogenase
VTKPKRVEPAMVFKPSNPKFPGKRKQWISEIRKVLYASKIISYARGYLFMRAAAKQCSWNLNNGGIALNWQEYAFFKAHAG